MKNQEGKRMSSMQILMAWQPTWASAPSARCCGEPSEKKSRSLGAFSRRKSELHLPIHLLYPPASDRWLESTCTVAYRNCHFMWVQEEI